MCKRCKKLIALALTLVMALAMTAPALAAKSPYAKPYGGTEIVVSDTTTQEFKMWKNALYEGTTVTLYKVPTSLESTPLPEDLNLDPLAYWEQIIPISYNMHDAGVEKTTLPSKEIYQEIYQLVNELTAGLTTDSDKYTAIYMWVHNNIGYSTENRTDNVYLVYERGYGACSESANLRYLMATMAGIRAAILTSDDHQSVAVLDENSTWFGDRHNAVAVYPAKRAYYTDGLNQYVCDLETGKLTKLRTIEEKKKPIDAPSASFSDVPADAWFADAVNWAIAEGITDGDGANAFNPYGTCTNDHIITFLYRAAGKPAAGSARPSFTIKNAWAADAINWAYSKGFINSNFEENTPCTRATAVDYMWRVFGKPSAQTSASFTDMAGYGYYVSPVSWAVEQGIVEGTGGNNFSPSLTCNRATIVTMLYRAYSG